jgi:hypothetical protein
LHRPEPFLKLCFCETDEQKLRLPEHSDVISTKILSVELHFHVEIPRVIFLRFGRYVVVNVMVKKERNELIERHVGKVN